MSNVLIILCSCSVIACALVAGVFLGFSDFIMRSLDKIATPGGVEAMQHINREVFRTIFMILLIGMSIVSPVLMWVASQSTGGDVLRLILAGGASYLVLVFAVTLLGNVPMNRRLGRLDAYSQEAANYWLRFYPVWTRLNHLRSFGAALAACFFLLACLSSTTT